jgi:tetratricopeptide (TPR) repeat protein
MSTKCSRNRSIYAAAAVFAVFGASGSSVWAQKPEVQRLFQSGSYEQAVEAAQNGDPATTYIAAQSLLRLERADQAGEQFNRLSSQGQDVWRLIGSSGNALIANNAGEAVALARKATEADGGNPFAHYQLGLSASKATDWGTAVPAFTQAAKLKPDFAYAHYYAALAYQRQRNLSKTAEHFDAFLRLAPDAPERGAVMAILRTIK